MKIEGNLIKRKKWTNHQVETLIHLAETTNYDWDYISKKLRIKTAAQCKMKYQNLTSNIKRGKWTKEEDKIIVDWVLKNGETDWFECASFLQNREGKQCRERWVHVLNPKINKESLTIEEQYIIYKGVQSYWNKWKRISGMLWRRSTNTIKNFVNSTFRSIKKSSLIWYLRKLLVIPTYINKGNKLTARIQKKKKRI
jgi:hypothetical protein